MLLGIITAMVSGILMSVQGVFNSEVTKQTSVWTAAAFVQATAFCVCITAWFISVRESRFLTLLKVEPKYLLLGGVIGAFITYTVIQSVQLLGPAKATIFIVALQIVSAYIIELLGLFGVEKADFEWKKAIGIVFLTIGVILFKK